MVADEVARVVSLRGEPVPLPQGAPNPDIVDLLEKYLIRAKHGEIDGIAIAVSRPNNSIANAWDFGSASFRLIASVSALNHDICDAVQFVAREVESEPL